MRPSVVPRPLAVVTGASSGIGRELARELASHGHDLILAADESLDLVEEDCRARSASVTAVQVDLTDPSGVAAVHRAITDSGREVDVLVLNAGRGIGGAFADTSLRDDLAVIDVNVRSTVHLAKLVVPAMARAGRGRVLFTSSIAATMPGPFQSVYNASKSFVQSFALALRNELKPAGVSVTVLMPGPTDTRFFDRARLRDTRMGANPTDDPADVARMGVEALLAGEERVIASSPMTRIQGRVSRVLPDSVKAQMHRVMAKPGSGR